ncbi:hypothetical protein Tco_1007019 [Tanacetum coccineum]|uniref:Uncharacterized protein n=1 Tax=Tanacetum coccineum TaxID=301880 RepID=A0ABQ5FJE6_9ASTR
MERELRMTSLLTDLCHEVTDAVQNKVELIEEIKQLDGTAIDSDHMAFVRILCGEDLDKAKSIMKLNTYKKFGLDGGDLCNGLGGYDVLLCVLLYVYRT